MRKYLKGIFVIYALTFNSPLYADFNPANLIKVTPQNKAKCVEYYIYKNTAYCSTTAQNAQPIDPQIMHYEKQKIVFDERPWQAVFGEKTPDITTVEYIPANDKIEKWHELVTSQFIPDPENRLTPHQYEDGFIKEVKNAGFSPIFTTIKNSAKQVIFEYQIESPPNQIQDELQMVTRGQDGLYIIHYVIKEADMGQKNREKWLHILESSSIAPNNSAISS